MLIDDRTFKAMQDEIKELKEYQESAEKEIEFWSNRVKYSGQIDRNKRKIYKGDKVNGLFLYGDSIVGVCDFQRSAFGVKWMRGDIEEFTPFCCTHGVEWEVVDDE